MSSVNNLPLTKEQEDLLRELEEEFKDRYTEKDENFMAVFNEKPPQPPIVENWFEHRFRNRGDNDRRHGYTYEGDRHYDYNDRRHRYHSYEDHNDRRHRYHSNYDHSYRRYHYHNQRPF